MSKEEFELFTAASTSTANSPDFQVPTSGARDEVAILEIYGTIGSATFALKFKDKSGGYNVVNSALTLGVGQYIIPYNKDAIYRLEYTAGGGSSIGAVIKRGRAVTTS